MYYEAQELQICGFWTVNVPVVHSFCNDVRDLFPPEELSILVGQLFWMFVCLCFRVVLRGGSWVVALVPAMALLGTLLVAPPIWYWLRSTVAIQLLLPFCIAMMYCLQLRSINILDDRKRLKTS